jgi:lipopolysaccharide/colanic/teichoic acid biosynthesis glycosyltransferase
MRVSPPASRYRLWPRLAPFDVAWLIVAPFAALALRDDQLLRWDVNAQGSFEAYQYALITVLCALPAVAIFRLCDSLSRHFAFGDVWAILGAAVLAASASAALTFTVNRLDHIPRSTPAIYAIVLLAGLVGGRVVARAVGAERANEEAWAAARRGARSRRVIVVGVDRFSTLAIKLVQSQAPRAVEIVAALDPRVRLVGRTISGVKIVGAPDELAPIVKEYKEHGVEVDEVWVADEAIAFIPDAQRALSEACEVADLHWSFLSRALNLVPARSLVASTGATAGAAPRYFRRKRPFDAAVATVLLVALAPLAAIVAAIAAYDVGTPIVFWQERIGRNGRRFLLYKFRTFRAPFDRKGGTVPQQARMSRIGAFVRRSRLDEIPQLWNIIRGEMSLIGPRPLLPVDQPEDSRTRLLVRPGVTGWAQVNGATLVTADEKDALDAWYIHHASPALDLRIALRTLAYLVRGERKDEAAIDEALRWRREAREIDDRFSGGGSRESACEGEPGPSGARYDPVEAAQ